MKTRMSYGKEQIWIVFVLVCPYYVISMKTLGNLCDYLFIINFICYIHDVVLGRGEASSPCHEVLFWLTVDVFGITQGKI